MGCSGSKAPSVAMIAPKNAKFRVAIVGLGSEYSGEQDKSTDGQRFDSMPIANSIIKQGIACELIDYTPQDHEGFMGRAMGYDGVILRFSPDDLENPDVNLPQGALRLFNNAMDNLAIKGKAVWSSSVVLSSMGAKDALVKIKELDVGLPDTFSYFDKKSFDEGIKKSLAFSPRVIKQNRGHAGEGVWLVWLESKRYCETFGEKSLTDRDRLKLMEMNDNHVEYHTVKEFVDFCVNGPTEKNQLWSSSFPGKYLEGGKAAGGQIVDQRLLPRIVEGEVRLQMVRDVVYGIVHKQPHEGEMTAVATHAQFTYYPADEPRFAELKKTFLAEMGRVMDALGIAGEPLPILWTADFIPVDNHASPYVVGEFNCSCVNVEAFADALGADLKAVSKADMEKGYRITDLMGLKVLEQLEEMQSSGGFTSIGRREPTPVKPPPPPTRALSISSITSKSRPVLTSQTSDLAREKTPLPVRPR
mmetsp:Transcript_26659/g.54572  ORF Transcript_26659/g.54572 Transcript_26659/m.54572 type:complete len:473 (+) Transcript_26659:66-1484(+)